MMRAGTFREDLYYRLQVIELMVPPLRDRREEIGSLVEFFTGKYTKIFRRPAIRASRQLHETLSNYKWPGNIRELENMIKRFVVLQDEHFILSELERLQQVPSRTPVVATSAVGAAASSMPAVPISRSVPMDGPETASPEGDEETGPTGSRENGEAGVDLPGLARAAALRAEREAIQLALTRFRWNRRKAAGYLNVSYKTLLTKIKECGIRDSESS
jgi:two-component system, NtrC family, response regulator AtoC